MIISKSGMIAIIYAFFGRIEIKSYDTYKNYEKHFDVKTSK